MKAQTALEMTFRRDISSGTACLEYSWVPEGKRRAIFLEVGQQVGSNNDSVPDTYIHLTCKSIPCRITSCGARMGGNFRKGRRIPQM